MSLVSGRYGNRGRDFVGSGRVSYVFRGGESLACLAKGVWATATARVVKEKATLCPQGGLPTCLGVGLSAGGRDRWSF